MKVLLALRPKNHEKIEIRKNNEIIILNIDNTPLNIDSFSQPNAPFDAFQWIEKWKEKSGDILT